MNSKIALSGLSILASLALIAGATFAYFNDAGTSNTNVFAAGNLDLGLTDSDQTDQDNVLASFGGTNLAPGTCLDPATLSIKNFGTVAGNHIDLSATNTNNSFASVLKLDTFTFNGGDIPLTDGNVNGIRDLEDLATSGVVNLAMTDFVYHPLVMKVCLDISAGNTLQGATDTMNLSVLLDQGPH